MEKDGDYLSKASEFLYLYLLYVQKPLLTSLRDEKDKKGMQGRVKLPCMGYMQLLTSRCVVCRFMVIPMVTVSYCLFREILGLCVNVSMPLWLFSIISPSAWCLSIVTDGHASSDWSLGPMLVCVCLGVICIVIGSSLMFLVFFVYVFDKEKFVHICFITTYQRLIKDFSHCAHNEPSSTSPRRMSDENGKNWNRLPSTS